MLPGTSQTLETQKAFNAFIDRMFPGRQLHPSFPPPPGRNIGPAQRTILSGQTFGGAPGQGRGLSPGITVGPPGGGFETGALTPPAGVFEHEGIERGGQVISQVTEKTTEWHEALKIVGEEFSKLNIAINIVGGVADTLMSNVSGGLVAMTTGAKSAKEAFQDMAKSILADLQRIIIQALIAKALGALVGALTSPAGPGASAPGLATTESVSGGLGRTNLPNFSLPSQTPAFAHGGFVKPGQIVRATLHGGKFGEEINPLTSPGRFNAQSAVGGGGGGTTIIYNIQAIDVEDFDNKVLGAVGRRDGEVSSIVAARSRNSAPLRTSFGIA